MDDDEEYARYQHAVASGSQLDNEGGQHVGGRLTDTNDERGSNAPNAIDEPEYDVMPEWDDAGGKSTIPEAKYDGLEVEAVEQAYRNEQEQDSDDFKYYQHHFNMNRNHYRFWLNLKTDHERMEYLKEMKRQMHEPEDADNYTLEQQREKDLRQAREELLKDVTTNEHMNDFCDPNDANVRNRYAARPHNKTYEEDHERHIGREERNRRVRRDQQLRKARDGKKPARAPSPNVPSPGEAHPKVEYIFGEHGRDGHRARPPRGGFFEDPEIIREVVRQTREENAKRAKARERQLNAAAAQVEESDGSKTGRDAYVDDHASDEPQGWGVAAPRKTADQEISDQEIGDPAGSIAAEHKTTAQEAEQLETEPSNNKPDRGLNNNDSDAELIEEPITEGLRVLNISTDSNNVSTAGSEHTFQYGHGPECEQGLEHAKESAKDHDSVSSPTGSFRSAASTFSAMQREVDELKERQQALRAKRMKEEELTSKDEAEKAGQKKEQAHTAEKSKQTFTINNEALGEQVSPISISIAEKASNDAVHKERDALEEQVSPASTSKAKASKEAGAKSESEDEKDAQPEEGVGIFTKYLREKRATLAKEATAKKQVASNNQLGD